MEYERYKQLLSDMVNPDKQAEAILAVSDGLETDLARLRTLEDENKKLTETVASLRDTNSKLVLRVTEPLRITEVEEEETPEKAFNTLIGKIKEEDK